MATLDTEVQLERKSLGSGRPFGLSMPERRFLLTGLVLLLAIRVLFMLWLPFTDSTEARYAEIARKMIETGDWITPQYDYGIPFWGKPPMHTWFSALGMQVFGVGAFGARVFIFLAGLTVLALSGSFMKRHMGRDHALVALVVLFSTILYFGASAFVMTDMVMVLGTTLGMVGFYTQVTDRSGGNIWGYLFFVGLAIGLLAKGPVAAVLTIMPIGLWVLTGWRWSSLRTLPWLGGIALLLALTLPWYVAAELKTPGFIRYFIVGEHFERFTVSGWEGDLYGSGHAREKGLIWLFWLGAFFPWTLFAGWMILRAKSVVAVVKEDTRGWHSYLLFWAIAPMLLFTPAANILAAYVLPGLPAATLLLVSLWTAIHGSANGLVRTTFGIALGAVMALFFAATFLSFLAPDVLKLNAQKALVEQAAQIDPDMRLTYWGGRSYSAEFYTRGQAHATSDYAELKALVSNDVRDAVVVRPDAIDDITAALGDSFSNAGIFGRNHLLVEAAMPGESQ